LSCRYLVFSPRLSSSSRCTALSSSHCAGWLLLRRLSLSCRLVLLLCHTLVLSSFSHCTAASPSHCAVWLLHRLSPRCPLVLLSSSHCAALSSSNCAGWLLRCLSLCHCLVHSSSSHCAILLSRHPLTAPPSHRLIA
jgi:hypothetical protein